MWNQLKLAGKGLGAVPAATVANYAHEPTYRFNAIAIAMTLVAGIASYG